MFAESFFAALNIWRTYPTTQPLRTSQWTADDDGVEHCFAVARARPQAGRKPAAATVPMAARW